MKKKLFNEYATITTKDDKVFNIRKKRIFINGKSTYYGKLYIISSEDKNDVEVIDEVFSFDNNRLRLLTDSYINSEKLDTVEHANNNTIDRPITVVTHYDSVRREIKSIGNIKSIKSDTMNYHINTINKEYDDIKQLILK